jgi:hypothetical protein
MATDDGSVQVSLRDESIGTERAITSHERSCIVITDTDAIELLRRG